MINKVFYGIQEKISSSLKNNPNKRDPLKLGENA